MSISDGEPAFVIEEKARQASETEARVYYLGSSINNDPADREWQLNDPQWFLSEGSDSLGSIRPAIATGLNCSVFCDSAPGSTGVCAWDRVSTNSSTGPTSCSTTPPNS